VIAGVLCNLDRDTGAAREIVAGLTGEIFQTDPAAIVFRVISLAMAEVPDVSILDVMGGLARDGHGQGSEPYAWVAELVAEYVGLEWKAVRLAREAADELRAARAAREAMHAAEQVVESQGQPEDVNELRQALERLSDANHAAAGNRPITIMDCADQWARHERTPVVPTGLDWFDGPAEGGLPIGGITALVAYPQVGKSALALNLTMASLIADESLRAVWALGEMTPEMLASRAACVASTMLDGCEPIITQDARDHTPAATLAMRRMCEVIGGRLAVVPAPLTVDRIEERVISTGARLVVVDYLQLVQPDDDAADRVHQLDQITGRIRDMAITREIAVILISSMAKAAGKESRIGQLAKGSSEIDYAAELMYLGEASEQGYGHDGCIDVTWRCKKARNFQPRDLLLRFDGDTQSFDIAGFDEFSSFAPKQPR
jgi:replicative DNA helicase